MCSLSQKFATVRMLGLSLSSVPCRGSIICIFKFLYAGTRSSAGRYDPLSPYLFEVAVETLAIALRQHSDIKRIYIEQQETKLLQYAGDTTAILANTISAKVLFELVHRFQNISGLKINCSKTEGMCKRK